MTVKKFSLNHRFLKTCNGFCNAKHKLVSERGQSDQDVNACFAGVLFQDLHCSVLACSSL